MTIDRAPATSASISTGQRVGFALASVLGVLFGMLIMARVGYVFFFADAGIAWSGVGTGKGCDELVCRADHAFVDRWDIRRTGHPRCLGITRGIWKLMGMHAAFDLTERN